MNKKCICAIALTAMLLAAALFSGCAAKPLAAKAGDREITVQQLENMYTNSASYATYYGYDVTTSEGVESFQDYLLDSAVRTQVQAYEAQQAGVTLTDEQKTEAQKTADESYESTWQQFVSQAESSGSTEPEVYANKIFSEALASNGTTVAGLKADYLKEARDSYLIENHRAQLLTGVELTAQELKTKYDESLAQQKTLFTSDPSQYFTYESNANYGGGTMPLYIPEGLFRVKHILVEEEETAKEVKAKLDAGEDFDALLAEYGTDDGMKSEQYADGYLVGEGANYVEAFLNAAMALEKDGDISDVVQSDYGYHILKRLKDEPSREIPYEEVQTAFDEYEQTAYQTEYYNSIVTGWMEDTSVVTRYPENYRSIGKAALEG